MATTDEGLRDQVRDRYARAALTVTEVGQAGTTTDCCGGCGPTAGATVLDDADAPFGAGLYEPGQTAELPEEAVLASLGCGNPLAVAQLRAGERVLDLGSGSGMSSMWPLTNSTLLGPALAAFAWANASISSVMSSP